MLTNITSLQCFPQQGEELIEAAFKIWKDAKISAVQHRRMFEGVSAAVFTAGFMEG